MRFQNLGGSSSWSENDMPSCGLSHDLVGMGLITRASIHNC